MSDTLPAQAGVSVAEQLDAFHSQVVSDVRLDYRYSEPMTNVQKVAMVCGMLEIAPETFDLNANFPMRDWSNSNDTALLRCGLYIADMRQSFFGLIIGQDEKGARHDVWEMHAESQYWMEQFDSILYRRQSGEKRPARRVVH